jgi:hypothetical protein
MHNNNHSDNMLVKVILKIRPVEENNAETCRKIGA